MDELLEQFDDNYHPLVRLAKAHGIEAVETLLQEAGGTKPHLPTLENFTAQLQREVRNSNIREKFNGRNYEQLGMEFGLGERQLREILHAKPRSYKKHKDTGHALKCSAEVHDQVTMLAGDYDTSVREFTDAVLTAALEHKDIHAALRKALGGQQMTMEMEEAA